ncbi:helix-turn-helix transcriptional regulator [Candidatus Thiosymbion oneisti]|uniref:helix-turn-helix transcriptional regulator n=1 Tax=Candidatus Thiosymbion oneisti TaxID=589554 RepID=UPI001FB08613|nr:DNA-binding protein [Candidatus Thiosymbion oneisti]
MKDYEFTLKYRLGEACEDPEQYLGALAEAGCEDAVVGIGQNGRISLSFTRESESALAAISSALEDVQRAIPDAKLVEATPDFVGVTDIADLFGVSRQYIRQLIQGKGASFPEPIHEGKPSLWHLTDVLAWFQENQAKAVEPEVYEVSQVNMQVNVFKSCVRATAVLQGGFQFVANAPNNALQGTLSFAVRP